MKNTIRQIISIATVIVALCAASCQKDDTLYYGNFTMGNVVDGKFVSDQGNTFNVVEQLCGGQLDTMKRAIMVCDVLKETEGKENEYDIRLTQLSSVLTKDPIATSDAVGEDLMAADPIHLEKIWYSGGYLNLYITVPFDKTLDKKHLINLIYNTEEDGSLTLELRHNAYSDIRDDKNVNMVLGANYVSFPILGIINSDSAKITVKWKWYESAGFAWTSTEKEYTMKFDWKREGYEHVPVGLAVKSFSNIL